jgi:para-nitrobenzyl esterase
VTIVATRLGAVRGVAKGACVQWRGIPYAAPPTGERRFRAPAPAVPWTGERDATKFGPVAMQARDPRAVMVSGIAEHAAMSEDCLVVNVYAPASYADGRKRPVMVWIHGGAFIMGTAAMPLYNGAAFAERDIVVVTLNYRLGLFGLLYLGDLGGAEEGNCALLDQVAALRWVRDNIAAFGGDPDRVTVMGESAGAVSVANLLAMPAARGLFQRAILQSGASGLSPPTRADATELATSVLADLGVTTGELADLPADRILAVQQRETLSRGLGAFSPYVDGVTIPRLPIEIVAAGQGARVPLLLGSNRDEWSLFDVFLGEGVTRIVRAQIEGRLGAETERVVAAYRETRGDKAWLDLIGDVAFRIPMIRLAEHQPAPVYMYRFDWTSPAMNGRLGAAHAMELPFVWNALDLPFSNLLLGDVAALRPFAARLHETWCAFIRDGTPDGGGLPPWPAYTPDRRATMLLDHPESRVVDDPDGTLRELWP